MQMRKDTALSRTDCRSRDAQVSVHLETLCRYRLTFPSGFSKVSPVDARSTHGDVAQLGEHCLRKAGVESSNLFISTTEYATGQTTQSDRSFFLIPASSVLFLSPRRSRHDRLSSGRLPRPPSPPPPFRAAPGQSPHQISPAVPLLSDMRLLSDGENETFPASTSPPSTENP